MLRGFFNPLKIPHCNIWQFLPLIIFFYMPLSLSINPEEILNMKKSGNMSFCWANLHKAGNLKFKMWHFLTSKNSLRPYHNGYNCTKASLLLLSGRFELNLAGIIWPHFLFAQPSNDNWEWCPFKNYLTPLWSYFAYAQVCTQEHKVLTSLSDTGGSA